MKKLKLKWLGLLALITLIVPIFTMAANPVLDSANLYKIANKNISNNWVTSTNASPGQTINFMVHIHNGNIDTTANGIRVQTTLPTGVVSNFTSTATVSASNTGSVSGTTTIYMTQPATLSYVPGSTVMYNHLNQVEANLPDGITGAGINVLNELKGCWEYERFVMYKAIVVAAPVAPTCTISAAPTSIERGSSATLSFSSTNATSGSISSIGSVGASGTRSVSPTANTTYTYSVSGPGGNASCNTAITVYTVEKPKPTCSLSASPISIEKGASTTLTFGSTHATNGVLSGFGSVGTTGTRTVSPSVNTTYNYVVNGEGGEATCPVTVEVTTKPVNPPVTPPVITGKGNIPLPTSGPAEAAAGAAGLTATGGAAYAWLRSKKALLSALTKIK